MTKYHMGTTSYNQEAAFPGELLKKEVAAIGVRRTKIPGLNKTAIDPKKLPDSLPKDTVGLACSGGGIRSATFSLGVLQSLAKWGLLREVDYLSTVSGGGYIGGFWGGWVNRLRPMEPGGKPAATASPIGADFIEAEAKLSDTASFPVGWLRENGRYLTPGGADDAWLAATVYQRNLVILHVFLAPLFLVVFSLLAAIRMAFPKATPDVWSSAWRLLWPRNISIPHVPFLVETSGYLWTIAAAVLGAAILVGVVYLVRLLMDLDRTQNNLTRLQAVLIQLFFIALVVVGLDAAGATAYNALKGYRDLAHWSGAGVSLAALVAASTKIRKLLGKKGSAENAKIESTAWIVLGASALALVWLCVLSVGGYGAAHLVRHLAHPAAPVAGEWTGQYWVAFAAPAAFAFLGWIMGLAISIGNDSSLASLYSARLSRAYLGASNPARKDKADVTATIPGDQINFDDYKPHEAGGPVHLINVTVNETLDPRSAVQRNDRKGTPMAVSPCGISVGVRHHAVWNPPAKLGAGRTIQAIKGEGFNLFKIQGDGPIGVEPLTLGEWIGVSGAAFTTGLGARTSLPLSFLLGFFNIRLGWWWDSGVSPSKRKGWADRPLVRKPEDMLNTVFELQSLLLDEFTARFHGTARQRWYLSDGGHFENTAAYEMVRRRVPFIIVCDDGCDPERVGDDFANLVRKARIDFHAEVEVIDPAQAKDGLREHLGTLGELFEKGKPDGRRPLKCALLARVSYPGTTETSLLLLIKPTVCGDESAAERNYALTSPPFPQQTTMDQFFGEDQWESYRALGERTGDKLFSHAAGGTARNLVPANFI